MTTEVSDQELARMIGKRIGVDSIYGDGTLKTILSCAKGIYWSEETHNLVNRAADAVEKELLKYSWGASDE
jgi:hypothetical protein